MQFFVLLLMMQVVFVVIEHEILHFYLQYNLVVDNHKSPVFLVVGQVFCLGTFLVVMYLHVLQINHKAGVPQMGAAKIDF